VLHGKRLKLVYFEYALASSWLKRGLKPTLDVLHEAGFECYFAGKLALVKVTDRCWRPQFDFAHSQSWLLHVAHVAAVNVFCASARNAPDLVEVFDTWSIRPKLGAPHSESFTEVGARYFRDSTRGFLPRNWSWGRFVHR
jgi:hypothetical protein